jgi:hypothetical protein
MTDIPRVIAALHMLPSAVSCHRDAQPLNRIIDGALHHAQIAHDGGVRAFYIQDVHDTPVGPSIHPDTVANVTAVGRAVRDAFPGAIVGICLMQHGAREPLQICDAIGAHFVRLKVYMGTMAKAEGLLHGCAWEAIQTRHALGATHIRIFADIYDRVGTPVAPLPLGEACRQAVMFGKADALVLTGMSPQHTVEMLDEAIAAKTGVPLTVGGSVSVKTLPDFAPRARHFVVHAAFTRPNLPAHNGLPVEWDVEAVRAFMAAVPQQ